MTSHYSHCRSTAMSLVSRGMNFVLRRDATTATLLVLPPPFVYSNVQTRRGEQSSRGDDMTSCRPFLWQRCSSPLSAVVTSVQGCQTIPFLKFSDYLTSHYPHCHSTATLLVSRDVNLEVLRLSASHQRYYPVLHTSICLRYELRRRQSTDYTTCPTATRIFFLDSFDFLRVH